MIGYLKGKIIHISKDSLIVDVSGVGYKVYTNIKTINLNENKEFFIYTSVTQDDLRLFGFSSKDELAVFEQLIEVSGVGPKLGQQILAYMGIENFSNAINQNDTAFFSAVPKVGPKLATKIIVELKDKISWKNAQNITAGNPQTDEIISALEMLGYKKSEFISLINQIPEDKLTESEKIKWLLNELRKQ